MCVSRGGTGLRGELSATGEQLLPPRSACGLGETRTRDKDHVSLLTRVCHPPRPDTWAAPCFRERARRFPSVPRGAKLSRAGFSQSGRPFAFSGNATLPSCSPARCRGLLSPDQGGMFSPSESAPRRAACPQVQVHVRESRGPPVPTGLRPPADLQNCTKPWVAGASVPAAETGGPGPRGQVGSGHLRSLQAWTGASSLPREARVQPRPPCLPLPTSSPSLNGRA